VTDRSAKSDIRLCVPSNANFEGVKEVLTQLEPLFADREADEPRLVVVDMSSVDCCSATGITILAAALEDLFLRRKLRPGSQIVPPQRTEVTQFLRRMDFFKELGVRMDQLPGRPHGFRPVTHVADDSESPAVTRSLVEAVEESYAIDPITAGALKSCMNEVIENVFYHARSPIDALVSVQTEDHKVELVIVDTGRGIRDSLSEVAEYRREVRDDCGGDQAGAPEERHHDGRRSARNRPLGGRRACSAQRRADARVVEQRRC
jgi:hypothetical protein